MLKWKYSVIAVGSSLVLAGCAGQQGMTNNQALGTGVGVAGGATAGALIARSSGVNPLAGAIIGAVAGGIIGNAIGSALDEYEQRKMAEASRYAAAYAPTGQKVEWSGSRDVPPTGPPTLNKKRVARATPRSAPPPPAAATPSNPDTASGWVIPTSDIYRASDGRSCRDLQQVAVKSGKTYEQKVTACRTTSGWNLPTNG